MNDDMGKEPVKSTMTSNILNHMYNLMEMSLDLELVTNQVTRTFFGDQPPSDEKDSVRVENNEPGFETSINRAIDVLYYRIQEAILLLKKL